MVNQTTRSLPIIFDEFWIFQIKACSCFSSSTWRVDLSMMLVLNLTGTMEPGYRCMMYAMAVNLTKIMVLGIFRNCRGLEVSITVLSTNMFIFNLSVLWSSGKREVSGMPMDRLWRVIDVETLAIANVVKFRLALDQIHLTESDQLCWAIVTCNTGLGG